MHASVFSAVGCLLTRLVNQCHHSSGDAKENLPALWRCGINMKVWQDETSAGGADLSYFLPLCLLWYFHVVYSYRCVTNNTGGMSVPPFFDRKLIFRDLRGNRSRATISISILVDTLALNVMWALALAQQFGRSCSSDGAPCPQLCSSWHTPCRRWTLLYSLHCRLQCTPLLSASRVSKHHLSSVTSTSRSPCAPQHNPLCYFTLLISSVSHSSSLLFFWQTIQSSWWPQHLNSDHSKTLCAPP